MKVIVDTNVAVVANGRQKSPQASPACVISCAGHLHDLQLHHTLVIDDGWRILREYLRELSPSGQPGVGDAFLKWVLTNQANPARCAQVHITPRGSPQPESEFCEFPDDPAWMVSILLTANSWPWPWRTPTTPRSSTRWTPIGGPIAKCWSVTAYGSISCARTRCLRHHRSASSPGCSPMTTPGHTTRTQHPASGWRTVRFGDVVRNVDEAVRDAQTCDLERFVGWSTSTRVAAHQAMGPDRRGRTELHAKFTAGSAVRQRRGDQRKVAVADFEALCSMRIWFSSRRTTTAAGTVTVHRPDGRLLQLAPLGHSGDRFPRHCWLTWRVRVPPAAPRRAAPHRGDSVGGGRCH